MVVEGAEEVAALLRAQDINTLIAAVAPRGAALALIMQVALRDGAAGAKEVEGGGKKGTLSACMLPNIARRGSAERADCVGREPRGSSRSGST